MSILRQVLDRLREDARGASLYARSHWEAFSLSRKKKRDGQALLVAYREIGDRASESEEAKSRRSFGSARENEARLAECEAELGKLRDMETAARTLLEERTRVREGELEGMAAEAARLSRESDGAKRELRDLQKEIDRVEGRLEKPGDDDSPEALRTRLEELRSGRPVKEDADRSARLAAQDQDDELRREKQAWAEEEERLENELRDASREVRGAEVRHAEAVAAVAGSHEELGKSVVLAGLDEPGLKEPMDRAKGLLGEIKESDDGIRERRVAAATVRGEATRFVAVWGGALLVLLIVLGIAFSGDRDRGVTRILPEEPVPPVAKKSSGSAHPTAPAPPRHDPEPTAEVDVEKFRTALLAHPCLKSVKPTGKIEVLSRASAAGGAERIDVKVHAERDGEAVGVILRVTVSPDGTLLGVLHRGEETSEDDELMRLLEELE